MHLLGRARCRPILGADVGADFHRAMVASAPRETPHWAPPCEELDPPYDIKLVCFRAENYICSRENQQKLLPPELHFLTPRPYCA